MIIMMIVLRTDVFVKSTQGAMLMHSAWRVGNQINAAGWVAYKVGALTIGLVLPMPADDVHRVMCSNSEIRHSAAFRLHSHVRRLSISGWNLSLSLFPDPATSLWDYENALSCSAGR